MEELRGLVDKGFAELFVDQKRAEDKLRAKIIVSPLGDVVKQRSDGSLKHRLIQDFKASSVNSLSVVHERQVLPRFRDHARDLARASLSGAGAGVFILDFKHAFMTVPLHPLERIFNVSIIPEGDEANEKGLAR